jgi:hypothetical protein
MAAIQGRWARLYATGFIQESDRLGGGWATDEKKLYRFIPMKGLTCPERAGIVAPPSRPAEGQAL